MIIDKVRPTGKVSILLRDKDGNIKDERHIENLVVDDGLAYIASRMTGTAETAMSHMAIGTGTTAAAAADATLETELDRNALTSTTIVTTTATNDSVEYVGDWAASDGTGAITEAGIFNAAASGTLLCRTVFSVINKGASDTLSITWKVVVA